MTLSEVQIALLEWSRARAGAKAFDLDTWKRLSRAESKLQSLADQLEGNGK